jgi:hypothetical protein
VRQKGWQRGGSASRAWVVGDPPSCHGGVLWAPSGPRGDSGGPGRPAFALPASTPGPGGQSRDMGPACAAGRRVAGGAGWPRRSSHESHCGAGTPMRRMVAEEQPGNGSEQGRHGGAWGLALRHPCRSRGRPPLLIFVEAVSWLFTGEGPELHGITPPEPLPAPATP